MNHIVSVGILGVSKVLDENLIFSKVRECLIQKVVEHDFTLDVVPIQIFMNLLDFIFHARFHHVSEEGTHKVKSISDESFTILTLKLLINHVE